MTEDVAYTLTKIPRDLWGWCKNEATLRDETLNQFILLTLQWVRENQPKKEASQ